jgi:O-Antigen ligase
VRAIGRSMQPFREGTIALVAVVYTALALAEGGASQRLTAASTIGIWLVVAAGVMSRAWSLRTLPRPAIVTGACLAGLGVLTALSMIWANDAGRAFAAFVRVAGYLGLFAAVTLCVPRSGMRAWLIGLAAGLTAVCLISLATRFDPSLFGGGDRHLGVALPAALGRLSYPIGYWNGLAACLAIQVVLLIWFGARAADRAWRAISVALLPLPILGLYLTSSRGGFAAAAAGGLVLLAVERRRVSLIAGTVLGAAGGALAIAYGHSQPAFLNGLANGAARHQGWEVGLATAGCAIAVGLTRCLLDQPLSRISLPPISWRIVAPVLICGAIAGGVLINPEDRVSSLASAGRTDQGGPGSGHLLSVGSSYRDQYWHAALKAYASEPITGVGAGNYGLYWNAHPEIALPLVNAHSLYLETLAELGIVGLLLVLGFFATAALCGWRARRLISGGEAAPALAVLAAGALTAGLDWTWQIPAASVAVIAAAGLLTAARSEVGATQSAPAAAPSTRFGLGIAVIAIAWASIWAAGVLLISDLKLDASRSAAARGDLVGAANDARDAASVQPWSPEPRLQLALVEELADNLTAARAAADLAIDRASDDWRPWAVAARIDARSGRLKEASIEIVNSQRVSPVPLPGSFVNPIEREARQESWRAPLPLHRVGGENRE